MNQPAATSSRTIVFVAPRFHTNQIGIVRALRERGHNVIFHVLLRGKTEDYSVVEPRVIPESAISRTLRGLLGDGGTNRHRAFPSPPAYYRLLRSISPDIVIVRDPSRAFSVVAALCARLLGAKTLFYNQDFLDRDYSPARRFAIAVLVKVFAAAWYTPLAISPENANPPRGRYFVPFAVEGTLSRKSSSGPARILAVGKFNDRKNHLLLLEALAPVMAQHEAKAVFVGECTTAAQVELRGRTVERARALGIGDRISIVSNVPYREMTHLYQQADLFVLPASDEPAAISVLEALASGVPAICSDSCGTRFYIQEGRTGSVFRSGSADDLQRAITDWLTDRTRLRDAADLCLRSADKFSGEAFYSYFASMMGDRWSEEKDRW